MRVLLPRYSRIATFALMSQVTAGAAGCGANCDRNPDEPPVRFTEGTTDVAAGKYESAPVKGPYLTFPAGRTYRFVHGLGREPDCTVSFSFEEYPFEGDDPSGTVPAAGNQATFEAVESDFVDVRNDTCSAVRIRIVCWGTVRATAPADGGDAGP